MASQGLPSSVSGSSSYLLPSGGGFSICKMAQKCASDTATHVLQGRTKNSMAAIQLIYLLYKLPLFLVVQLLFFVSVVVTTCSHYFSH